jgi:hypothetical protein
LSLDDDQFSGPERQQQQLAREMLSVRAREPRKVRDLQDVVLA